MGKGFALVLVTLFLMSLITVQPATVKAQSKTIVVPDNYPTITSAIGNATNGDTILVRAGTYSEQALETNNTISLIGESSTNTIINLHPPSKPFYILGQYIGTKATAIYFHANNLVISGLIINSYGDISIIGDYAIIIGNTINGYQHGFLIQGKYETISNNTSNTVLNIECSNSIVAANSGTGSITISNFGSYNSVFDNNMTGIYGAYESSSNLYYRNIVKGGVGMHTSNGDIVANNTITDCTQGVNVEYGSNNIIVGNTITDNSGSGLATVGYVQGSLSNCGFNNLFYANYVANNALGVFVTSYDKWHTGNFTFYGNNFVNNNQQAQVILSNITTYWSSDGTGLPWSDFWNTTNSGNYWSDYNGTDSNGNGIGDIPYLVDGSEPDYLPLMNTFDISEVSIQLPSWANITIPNPLSKPSFPLQKITNPSSSPQSTNIVSSPTPMVPEFPMLTIPLLLVVTVVAGLLVYLKKQK